MNLLTSALETQIERKVLVPALRGEFELATINIAEALGVLYDNIPENKRISYGRVHTIKGLAKHLYVCLNAQNASIFEIGSNLFAHSENVWSTGVALGLLADSGIADYPPVLPYFESAASSQDWELREFAQMFFRRLVKAHPAEMQAYLLRLVKSEDPNLRRFVSETLRPVQENKWFYKDPEYSLTVLRHLFRERAPYPRTSVGNNLSDLARRLPELVYDLVEELVSSEDKNSYWIAYRACRNLVKKEPVRVMDLLGVDDYRYKKAVYRREDFEADQEI
jgi:3-methyladenine DNA glycosylase AlkC